MSEDQKTQRGAQAPARPVRTPIGQRNRMTIDPKLAENLRRRGLVPRWFNDVEGRIEAAQAAGYQFVHSDSSVGDRRVAEPTKVGGPMAKSVGGGTTAYLMATKQEFYDEDQRAKAVAVDASEEAMKMPKRINTPTGSGVMVYGPGLTKE